MIMKTDNGNIIPEYLMIWDKHEPKRTWEEADWEHIFEFD